MLYSKHAVIISRSRANSERKILSPFRIACAASQKFPKISHSRSVAPGDGSFTARGAGQCVPSHGKSVLSLRVRIPRISACSTNHRRISSGNFFSLYFDLKPQPFCSTQVCHMAELKTYVSETVSAPYTARCENITHSTKTSLTSSIVF